MTALCLIREKKYPIHPTLSLIGYCAKPENVISCYHHDYHEDSFISFLAHQLQLGDVIRFLLLIHAYTKQINPTFCI